MSTFVRATGQKFSNPTRSDVIKGTQRTFNLSNGNLLTLILDANEATQPGFGDGSNTQKIYVYESADRVSHTLRATIGVPATLDNISGASFVDNSLAIVGRSADRRTLHYTKLTYSGWSAASWEAAVTRSAPTVIDSFDLDVSDTGLIAIACTLWNGSNTATNHVVTKATTGGAWVGLVNTQPITSAPRALGSDTAAIICLGVSSGVRNIAYAFGNGTASTDLGVKLSTVRVTESTGAISGSAIDRATYNAGQATPTGRGRLVKFFRSSVSEFVMGIAHVDSGSILTMRGSFVTTAYVVANPPASSSVSGTRYGVAMTYGTNGINFHFVITGVPGTTNGTVVSKRALVTGQGITYYERMYWNRGEGNVASWIPSGGNRNFTNISHDLQMNVRNDAAGNRYDIRVQSPEMPNPNGASAIVSLRPGSGQTVTSARPSLTANVQASYDNEQSKYKLQYQFSLSPTFASGVVDYLQADTLFKNVESRGSLMFLRLTDTLPAIYALPNGLWNMRARLVNEYGQTGMWSEPTTFVLGHPPRAYPTSFTDSGVYQYGDGVKTFTWSFYDTYAQDYQTAYQFVLTDSTGATIADTGKVASTNQFFTYTVPAARKEQVLYWKVRLWDSQDTAGSYSEGDTWFTLSDPATISITSPVAAGTVTTGLPTFVWQLGIAPTKYMKEYTLSVSQGGQEIWSVRMGGLSGTDGDIFTAKMNKTLTNNQAYTVQVVVTDSLGLVSMSPMVQFNVAWVPPPPAANVVADTTTYNIEDEGYISILWDDTNRDPNFRSWNIFRKDDQIDPYDNSVIEEGSYKLLYTDYEVGTLYQYKDFFAPSGYKVSYRVEQSITRDGQDMDSESTAVYSVFPVSDGYWLIEPTSDDTDADAFKLSAVNESFSISQEQNELVIIGGGIQVEKGQKLGKRGTIDVQIRGRRSRQARLRLEAIQDEVRPLWLRNPFGDIFKVSVSDMTFERIPGVGRAEFLNVSIPYVEVK